MQNPGGDADSSSSSTTTVGTTKPIYPSVYIIEPSANYTGWVKKGEPVSVSISALGQDCVNMTAYINGELAGASNDNYLSCSYPITKSGQYHISVVGTSKTGHTSTSVRTVTVNDTYTVAYNLNGGEGVTPETQTVNVGEGMTLAIMAHPKDCYKLDHTFDGWCISPTGSDNLFIQGEETEFSTNVTLYAQFTYVVD